MRADRRQAPEDGRYEPITADPDHAWVLQTEAQPYLEAGRLTLDSDGALSLIKNLRKQGLSHHHARLIVSQLEWRKLGRRKFEHADQMYFTRRSLEQATDAHTAAYKASRFQSAPHLIDACCGIGGDLMSLSKVASTEGFDRDPLMVQFARANCRVNSSAATLRCDEFDPAVGSPNTWFHVDPDRRSNQKRTTSLNRCSPSGAQLNSLISRLRSGAIKLAPATELTQPWRANCEREWIGSRRTCKQLVAWFGETTDYKGASTATIITADGQVAGQVRARDVEPCPVADSVGDYLYEPHAPVLAAKLTDSVANECSLHRLQAGLAYLTSDQLVRHPALQCFKVVEVLRLQRRDIEMSLVRHDVGEIEVKKRGVHQRLLNTLSKLRLSGTQKMVVVLTRQSSQHRAILCRRESDE